MNESVARQFVETFAAVEKWPTLSANDVTLCLDLHRLDDGTFDEEAVMKATADAWDIKTGRVTDHHDVSVNGRVISAQQVKINCEERSRWFRRRLPVHVF